MNAEIMSFSDGCEVLASLGFVPSRNDGVFNHLNNQNAKVAFLYEHGCLCAYSFLVKIGEDTMEKMRVGNKAVLLRLLPIAMLCKFYWMFLDFRIVAGKTLDIRQITLCLSEKIAFTNDVRDFSILVSQGGFLSCMQAGRWIRLSDFRLYADLRQSFAA